MVCSVSVRRPFRIGGPSRNSCYLGNSPDSPIQFVRTCAGEFPVVANLPRRENTRKNGLRNPRSARGPTAPRPPTARPPGEVWRPLKFDGLYGRAAKDCGLRALKNLVNSFRKGTRWTRQITGSVDLSEMDCIAQRHTHDFRPVSPCKNGDWQGLAPSFEAPVPIFTTGSKPCLG